MRITIAKTGQSIDKPLERGLQAALARRICDLKGIKGAPVAKPARRVKH